MNIEIDELRLFGDIDNNIVQRIIDAAYPVGSLFWTDKSPEDDGDPNEFFVGTWERVKDVFIYNATDSDTVNDVIGSNSVTLNSKNLPKHTHTLNNHSHSTSGGISSIDGGCTLDDPISQCVAQDRNNRVWYGRFGYCNMWDISEWGSGAHYVNNSGGGDSHVDRSINFNHPHGNNFGMATSNDNSGDGNFSNTAFSVMPPHLNRYCWKRIG